MLLTHRSSIVKLCLSSMFGALLFWLWDLHSSRSSDAIRENVALAIPVESTSGIPRKLWYKLGPKGLSEDAKTWTNSCITKNPTYEVTFLTDETGDSYVKDKFASRPDITDVYLGLSIPILKADFLRYLLLFNEGGIWNDLDVACGDIPIDEWVPEQFKKSTGLVVGLEFDVGWGTLFTRQFESWTIMAKPKSPHMMAVIESILEGVREKTNKHNVSVSDLTFDMIGDVVDLTGPRRLTFNIYKSLSTTLGRKIDEKNVTLVMEPRLVGDVLVMPGYSFAASSNRYGENFTVGAPLVTHHYAGTWKNDHGGEDI